MLLIGNDGPPVQPEMRQAIFEKWNRGGQAGSRRNLGLGLYFCRLAMEAHGGRIWVGDEPLPTVFGLEIPIQAAATFLPKIDTAHRPPPNPQQHRPPRLTRDRSPSSRSAAGREG